MINHMLKKWKKISASIILVLLLSSCSLSEVIPDATAPVRIEHTPTLLMPDQTGNEDMEVLPATIPLGLEIQIWHAWSGEIANLLREMVLEFNEENDWQIKAEVYEFADGQVLSQMILTTVENGGTLPDLVIAPGYLITRNSNVPVYNFNEFLDSAIWGLPEEEIATFFPAFWDADVNDGVRFGVPAYRTGYFLFYNQGWAKELGFVNPPDSISGFRDQICAASQFNQSGKIQENSGTGGWIYTLDPYAQLSWMKAFNGGVINSSSGEVGFSQEKNIEAAAFLYDIFLPKNNCAWIGRQSNPYRYFSNRQALVYSGELEDILIQENVNSLNQVDDAWTILPYPSKSGKPVLVIDGYSYAISATEIHQALASWEFIRWMMRPENQARIVNVSGSFPLSTNALGLLEDFQTEHPVWAEGIRYLPFAEPIDPAASWVISKDILSDISWQLIQFTTAQEDLPEILNNADLLYQEIMAN